MATKTRRGYKVPCLKCGAEDSVSVSLSDVETFTCDSCSETFTADDVRRMLDWWEGVLRWVEMAPEIEAV